MISCLWRDTPGASLPSSAACPFRWLQWPGTSSCLAARHHTHRNWRSPPRHQIPMLPECLDRSPNGKEQKSSQWLNMHCICYSVQKTFLNRHAEGPRSIPKICKCPGLHDTYPSTSEFHTATPQKGRRDAQRKLGPI